MYHKVDGHSLPLGWAGEGIVEGKVTQWAVAKWEVGEKTGVLCERRARVGIAICQ